MFTKDENGIITFEDTSPITYDQWVLIRRRLNHIGFDFPDEDSVKEYFDRHKPLRKDQSDIVISVLKKKPIGYRMTSQKKERYLRRSVEQFGVTYNWEQAGYLLTDGTMLNFAGNCPRRVCDHRDIQSVVTKPQQIDGYNKNTCAMIEFMNYGHIRCQSSGFETATKLTREQKETIEKYMYVDGWIFVDIMNPNGNTVKHFEYQEWCPHRMFNDIDKYFDILNV